MASFGQVWKEWGVDDELSTPWMMVPRNGFNLVILRDGKDLTTVPENKQLIDVIDISDPQSSASRSFLSKLQAHSSLPPVIKDTLPILFSGVLTLASLASIRLFIVTGKSVGETIIKANDRRGVEKARINVSVKRRRTVKVAFNFVKHTDASGKEVNHTSKDPSQADQWIDGMNSIFAPQTNILFEKHDARWVKYKGTLDGVVRSKHLDDIFKERHPDSAVEMNIFLVGEWEKDSISTADVSQAVTVDFKNILCEDDTKDDTATTLAHEALHFLLREGHHTYAKEKVHWLMEQVDFRTGHKIPKEQADKVNPTHSTSRQRRRK